MCFVVVTLYNPSMKVPQRKEKQMGVGVGLFAGVIGTMTTVNGPFFIMYLLGLNIDRREILATLGLLFVVSGACFLIFWSIRNPHCGTRTTGYSLCHFRCDRHAGW